MIKYYRFANADPDIYWHKIIFDEPGQGLYTIEVHPNKELKISHWGAELTTPNQIEYNELAQWVKDAILRPNNSEVTKKQWDYMLAQALQLI